MKMELGAQTFTVRDYMQTTWDFREAMKRIAEIGYTCVQLSAVGNVPVQAQRDICDEFGLKIVLTHTNPDRMIADPEGVIRDHDILGCDYIGIGMMNRAPFLFVGAPSQESKTLAELIANAKARPGELVMAHAGKGTSVHMASALFFHQTGTKFLDVPYKGAAAALPDVVGGRANVMFDGANSSGPLVKEGKLRAYGITSLTRSPVFPDIPTLAEQGLPNYSFYVYLGLLAPANVPKDVVPRLAKALRTALNSDTVKQRFRSDAAEPGTMSPEEFTRFLKEDAARTEKVVADLGYAKE